MMKYSERNDFYPALQCSFPYQMSLKFKGPFKQPIEHVFAFLEWQIVPLLPLKNTDLGLLVTSCSTNNFNEKSLD